MAKRLARYALVCVVVGLGWLSFEVTTGCSDDQHPSDIDGGGGGGGQGDPCSTANDCALGFVCAGDGTCQRSGAPGTQNKGEGCAFNTDCVIDLVCSSLGKCVEPGSGAQGDSCTGNEGCNKGLLCSSGGKCAKPGDPGTKGPKEACAEAEDCAFGLVCINKVCTPLTYWPGVTCATDEGPLRGYFEIPRAGKKVAEFYRLPFPNDIRFKNGHVDLSDHPNPGVALPKEYGDIVAEFFKVIEEDVTGFGVNTATFLRLSRAFDIGTIGPKVIEFINIDKASPRYGNGVAYSMWATTGKGKYICNNYVAIRPSVGQPLQFKTTYAVMLKQGIKDPKGTNAGQDKDFKTMLAAATPADSDEKAAWEAYQPLRDYLNDKGILTNTIVTAAVFTTMDPRARMAGFRDVVHSKADAPTVSDLTFCDGKQKSPCDDGSEPTHKCSASPDPAFDELQGTYSTPVFQKGTPPYKSIADGGAITYGADGKPTIQRHENACFALTLPKGATMPAAGWPVAIFAHGTGGSYRSFINNKTAERLAQITDGANTLGRMAVISIDGSMHGPRRGSKDEPDELFFNLRNPRAARDNVYQGAADKHQLVRLVQSLNLDAATSPTGEALKFDPSQIYFFGHSQGTIEGVPFLAYEPEIKGTVLSGAGGYLLGSLLGKTKPVNVAGLVKLLLADNTVSTSHPLLNLLQLLYEEVDAVNYGSAIFTKPVANVPPKHTFLSYGVADNFTPPGTIDALGWSMSIRQVRQPGAERCGDGVCNGSESCKTCEIDCAKCPDGATCGDGSCTGKEGCYNCQEDCKPCPDVYAFDDPPVKGNIKKGGGVFYTAGMVQYSSDGSYDDHHVATKHPDGIKQTTQFFGTALADTGGVPTIIKVK